MPFSGSGSFSPYTPGNPVVSGAVISATDHNNTIADIASGLSNTVTRDGQSPPTTNLPMGNFKLTGLAPGTVTGDSVSYEQITNLASSTTAATQAAGDSSTKLATTAFVNASGRPLQKVMSSDAGSSVSSTTPGNMSVSNQVITPKSTSSTILVRCNFQATITPLVGNNVSAGFQLRDVTNSVSIGSARTFGNSSASGGVGLDGTVTLEAYVNNTVTTPRSFSLWGNSGNPACIASALSCIWTLEEVKN